MELAGPGRQVRWHADEPLVTEAVTAVPVDGLLRLSATRSVGVLCRSCRDCRLRAGGGSCGIVLP
jgi:hypothetical protein